MKLTARRIRVRASRRCGQLLKEIEKMSPEESGAMAGRADTDHTSPRKKAATDAGMSERQAKQSIRIANLPDQHFEEQVESDEPPTVTKLAEQGINRRGKYESPAEVFLRSGMTKEAFQAGMHLPGALEHLVETMKEYDPQNVVDGLRPGDKEELRKTISFIDSYLDKLMVKL